MARKGLDRANDSRVKRAKADRAIVGLQLVELLHVGVGVVHPVPQLEHISSEEVDAAAIYLGAGRELV